MILYIVLQAFYYLDVCFQCLRGIAANKINSKKTTVATTFFLVLLVSPKHHGISSAFEHARTNALFVVAAALSLAPSRPPNASENSLNRTLVVSPTPLPLSSSSLEINPSIDVALIDRLCWWRKSSPP